jgi:hypothetical protein
MQNPGTDSELLPTASFNVKDGSRSGALFTTPIRMGNIVSTTGTSPSPYALERGLYVFNPNTKISVSFEVDGDAVLGYAALASETKYWGVLLQFNLFAIR